MCPCGQPWRTDRAKGPAKPAAATGNGRKGRWWSKTDQPDKWQGQIEDAKERKLWELAVEEGPVSEEMALFRKRSPQSKRLEIKTEQPAAVVAAKAAQRLQTLENKLQGISKRHEEALAAANSCQDEGVKVATEIRQTKKILKEAESKVNPIIPEKPEEVGLIKPLRPLSIEQLAILEENPLAKQLAEDFNTKYSEAEARGKVLHDKVLELQAQKEEVRQKDKATNDLPPVPATGDEDQSKDEQVADKGAGSQDTPELQGPQESKAAAMERKMLKAEAERQASIATMAARCASYHTEVDTKAKEAEEATGAGATQSLG